MSYDINLRRDHLARWPDRCVCCGAEKPGHVVRLFTLSIGWWTLMFWSFGTLFSARVPACRSCGRRLQVKRVLKVLLTGLIAFAGVAVAFQIMGSYQGPLKKWLAFLVTLVCISPYLLWDVFFPPVFDMTCYSKTVDYEFRDSDYAFEFHMMNEDAEGATD